MLFVVIRQEGPGWQRGVPLREQKLWDEHATFMESLFDEGLVPLAGVLGNGDPVHRALNIFDADSEATVEDRLQKDPWTPVRVLETVSIERWEVLLGEFPSPNAV